MREIVLLTASFAFGTAVALAYELFRFLGCIPRFPVQTHRKKRRLPPGFLRQMLFDFFFCVFCFSGYAILLYAVYDGVFRMYSAMVLLLGLFVCRMALVKWLRPLLDRLADKIGKGIRRAVSFLFVPIAFAFRQVRKVIFLILRPFFRIRTGINAKIKAVRLKNAVKRKEKQRGTARRLITPSVQPTSRKELHETKRTL